MSLAFELYGEYLAGKSVDELAREYQLPRRSILFRLHIATVCLATKTEVNGKNGKHARSKGPCLAVDRK